jgi:hypothetical protein
VPKLVLFTYFVKQQPGNNKKLANHEMHSIKQVVDKRPAQHLPARSCLKICPSYALLAEIASSSGRSARAVEGTAPLPRQPSFPWWARRTLRTDARIGQRNRKNKNRYKQKKIEKIGMTNKNIEELELVHLT